jgi:hypothetical protein
MIIQLKKFGTTLISRQAGRESYLALQPMLKDIGRKEKIEIDFDGVLTFAPSWGDEFLTPLFGAYGDRLVLKHSRNLSVLATLDILEKANGRKFKMR